MGRKKRRTWSSAKKAELVQEHLVGRTPVSELCEREGVSPSVYYVWQKQLMDSLPAVFERIGGRKQPSREAQLEERIAALEAKIARKDNVIAEVSEEFVRLKKALGER